MEGVELEGEKRGDGVGGGESDGAESEGLTGRAKAPIPVYTKPAPSTGAATAAFT